MLNGTILRIAATSETDVPFAYIPACRTTTSAYPIPNASPLPSYAVGHGQGDHEKAAHPAEQEEPEAEAGRSRSRS